MNVFFYYFYTLLVYLVSFYRFLRNNIKTDNLTTIAQVIVDDIVFNIICVVCGEKSYKLCVLSDMDINSSLIKENLRKTVTHACICTFDEKGEMVDYIVDITEQLNSFRIYFEGHKKILWKHVILFLTKNKTSFPKQLLYLNVEGQETKHIIDDIMQMPFSIQRSLQL